MLKFHGHSFVQAMNQLSIMANIGRQDPAYLSDNVDALKDMTDKLQKELASLHLPLSIKAAKRMRGLFEFSARTKYDPKVFSDAFNSNYDDLKSRIEDELESSVIYCLSPTEASYALATEPVFGSDVDEAIPDAITDLSEARQCMAFARWTAAVFHLMRALELGVIALAGKMNVTVKDVHGQFLPWGPLLSNIDDGIKPMPPSELRGNLSQARALLYHVNKAWRTDTMHPKQTYTEEEARAAYEATGSFLRHLGPLVKP